MRVALPEARNVGRNSQQNSKGGKASNDDLAWSSQIRQDADGILHLRKNVVTERDNRGNVIVVDDEEEADEIDVTIQCGKQRNYKDGWKVPLKLTKSKQLFSTPLSIKYGSGVRVEPKRPLNLRDDIEIDF